VDFGDATGAWDASTRDQSAWLWWSFWIVWCKICVDNSLIRRRVEAQGRSKLKRLEVRGESSQSIGAIIALGQAHVPRATRCYTFLRKTIPLLFRLS
jgi:hypothetical protein